MTERRYYAPPAELVIDRVTAYIYRHYEHLLTEDEKALERLRIARGKAFGSAIRYPEDDPHQRSQELERFFKVSDLAKNHPDVYRRLQSSTIAAEMAVARGRILRDFTDQIILNKCPRCGALCLTPRAKACLDCGHTWHNQGEKK